MSAAVTRSTAKIDPIQAYKLRVANRLSYPEIAQYFGVRKQSVIERMQRLCAVLHEPEDHEAYQRIKPMLLSAVEEQLLASLTCPEKIEKASLNNVAYAYQQVANQLRLEMGQSTSNLGVLGKLIVQTHDTMKSRETPQPVVGEPESGEHGEPSTQKD
jgi:predicted DNA-binding protein YlxM (UPF0122 family)